MTAFKRNIKLTVAYDGTHYFGWQKTRMGSTIEESLQIAVEQILQEPVELQAASRTDAGVHAQGQIVNFFSQKIDLELHRFFISLNSLLPLDIKVLDVTEMPFDFHPTLQNIGKEYHYQMCYGHVQLPQFRLYSWHYPHELDIDLMRNAATYFTGRQDFTAFCNNKKNATYTDYIREVTSIDITEKSHKRLSFVIKGNNFLYKMVRNIVGTVVYVGCGKLHLEDLPGILSSKERTSAGMTAPAHGLSLHKVYY